MIHIAVLNYKNVYQEEIPNDTFGLLSAYPTDLIIAGLSRINAILFNGRTHKEQSIEIFTEVFQKLPGKKNPDYNNLMDKTDFQRCLFFTAASISYLMRECLQYYRPIDDSLEGDLSHYNEHLFKTILIYNYHLYEIDATGLETKEGLWALELRQQNQFRSLNSLMYTAPTKLLFIQQFFEHHPETRSVIQQFTGAFGLQFFWGFAEAFLSIIGSAINVDGIGSGKNILKKKWVNPHIYEKFRFLKTNSGNEKELSVLADIVPKPFYELAEEHFAILDYNYFHYILDQGMFWLIYKTTDLSLNQKFKHFGAFKAFIGYAYFEQFLLSKLLNGIFHKRNQILIENHKDYQDFWIKVNKRDLIIIEAKMTDAHYGVSENFNVQELKTFLTENFAQSKTDEKKRKGIHQLVRQIEYLIKQQQELLMHLEIQNISKLNVYPVLICSEQILDISGVNEYLDEIFQKQMAHLGSGFNSLKKLTLINVNTLVDYFKYFQSHPEELKARITSYHKYTNDKRKDYEKYGGVTLFQEMNVSFSIFLKQRLQYGKEEHLNSLNALRDVFRN